MKELTPRRITSSTAASALSTICSIYLPKEFQIYILKAEAICCIVYFVKLSNSWKRKPNTTKLRMKAQNLETSFLSEERTEEKKASCYNS
jgi:hypothetical protein